MKNKRVCVLLSTYNGEKYLPQLLDSVLLQQGVDIHILIRDDGSTDNTNAIIDNYVKKYDFVKRLTSTENFGPGKSFMELLYAAGAFDYYAFADQDDIWKKNKLIVAAEKLDRYDPKQNLLYCSNQTIYVNGIESGLRFSSNPGHDVVQLICGNKISGCTMVLNRSLKNYLSDYKRRPSERLLRVRMHDVWVLLVAQLSGVVIYDNNSYINYRIHDTNTVGLPKNSLRDKFRRAVIKLNDKEKQNGRQLIATEIKNGDIKMSPKNQSIIDLFVNYKNNFFTKVKLGFNKEIYKKSGDGVILFSLKALLGWI